MAVIQGLPQIRQVDVGQAMRTGQNIQYNRLRNEAAGMEMEEKRNMLENRRRAAEIRSTYERMPEQIQQLEEAGLFQEADQLRSQYISQQIKGVEVLETMRRGINADNYKQVRADLLQSGAVTPEMMPVEYSDEWFREQRDRQKNALSKMTRQWLEGGAVLQQDIITNSYGDILWQGTPFESGTDRPAGGDGREYGPSDANAIRSQISQLFSDFRHPVTGQPIVLDETKTRQVAALQEEAERIYRLNMNDPNMTYGRAVNQAARSMGINVANLQDSSVADPLGLLGDQSANGPE